MLLFLSILLGLTAGLRRRGDFFRLAELRGLCFAILPLLSGLALKAWPSILLLPKAVLTTAAYGGVLVFLIQNRRALGPVLVLGLGTLSNYLVIALNSFRMPVTVKAMEVYPTMTPEALVSQRADYFIAGEGTRLLALGDVIYFPPKPFDGFFSIGDVLLALGMFWLIVHVMGKNMRGQTKRSSDMDE